MGGDLDLLAGIVDALPAAIDANPVARDKLCAVLGIAPQPEADPDRWIGTREAADHLGMTVDALHKLTAARTIPFEQDCPGGKLWFTRRELDRWRSRRPRGEYPRRLTGGDSDQSLHSDGP